VLAARWVRRIEADAHSNDNESSTLVTKRKQKQHVVKTTALTHPIPIMQEQEAVHYAAMLLLLLMVLMVLLLLSTSEAIALRSARGCYSRRVHLPICEERGEEGGGGGGGDGAAGA
jgi:uncharacterized membrane protein